jgi:alpha-ribazole phosphatase
MTETTRLLLIRHAQPDAEIRDRVCGRLDVGLSPRGHRTARHLARTLNQIDLAALYVSPSRRARETASPLADEHELTANVEAELKEIDFGQLEGRSYEEIARRYPELYRHWMEHPTLVHFPGGESYEDLRRRVLAASQRIRTRHPGRSIAIVTHAGVIRALISDCLAMPNDALFRLDQAYGALSVVDWIGPEPLVRLVNGQPTMVAHRRRGFLPSFT